MFYFIFFSMHTKAKSFALLTESILTPALEQTLIDSLCENLSSPLALLRTHTLRLLHVFPALEYTPAPRTSGVNNKNQPQHPLMQAHVRFVFVFVYVFACVCGCVVCLRAVRVHVKMWLCVRCVCMLCVHFSFANMYMA